MQPDFLEQLAALDVPPPPPPQFDRQLHQRVNRRLTAQHVVDFVLGALPWAVVQMAGSVAALLAYTVTGRYPGDKPRKKPDTAP